MVDGDKVQVQGDKLGVMYAESSSFPDAFHRHCQKAPESESESEIDLKSLNQGSKSSLFTKMLQASMKSINVTNCRVPWKELNR